MIDAVFISDLHLHPDDAPLMRKFDEFLKWVVGKTKTLYILGDFFHVWAGDDTVDSWSLGVARKLAKLSEHNIRVYFMHGNRDFLLGPRFAELSNMTLMKEPAVVTLGDERILLVHGDRYCTLDKRHQWLRRLTRNWIFTRLFLACPRFIRSSIVSSVRKQSQMNRKKTSSQLDIVPKVLLNHMDQLNVRTVIHGHTHKPGLIEHKHHNETYRQYILSDWDDKPSIMCYYSPNRFYFDLFGR